MSGRRLWARIVRAVDEPSTWAGLSALAILVGRHDVAQAVQLAGAAVPDLVAAGAAVVAIVKREKLAP